MPRGVFASTASGAIFSANDGTLWTEANSGLTSPREKCAV